MIGLNKNGDSASLYTKKKDIHFPNSIPGTGIPGTGGQDNGSNTGAIIFILFVLMVMFGIAVGCYLKGRKEQRTVSFAPLD